MNQSAWICGSVQFDDHASLLVLSNSAFHFKGHTHMDNQRETVVILMNELKVLKRLIIELEAEVDSLHAQQNSR